jgi:hypothetical protein
MSGLKKIPVVPVPDRPYFFLLTLFSPNLLAAAKMMYVFTLIIEKTMKKIFQKKFPTYRP